jgi:CheY-like chemotaxis protein
LLNQLTPVILIVDDDASMRRLIATLLRSEGYMVDEASDGPTALDHISQRRPDLVLLDLMMPGMDGQQVFAAARALEYHHPIAFVSASVELTSIAERLGCGHIAKPFLPEVFLERVATFMERRPINDED